MSDPSAPQAFGHWLIEIGPPSFPLAGSLQLIANSKLTTLPQWPGSEELTIDGSIEHSFFVQVGDGKYTFLRVGGNPSEGTASGTVTNHNGADEGTWSATAQTGNPRPPR